MKAIIAFEVDTVKLFDLFRENPNMQGRVGDALLTAFLTPLDISARETVVKEMAGIRVLDAAEVDAVQTEADQEAEGRRIFEAQVSHVEDDATVTIYVRTSRVRADGHNILIDKASGRQSLYASDATLAALQYLIPVYRAHPENPANVSSQT